VFAFEDLVGKTYNIALNLPLFRDR